MAKTLKNGFSISLTLGGKTYTSSGETAFDALHAFVKPEKLTAKGIVTVEREGLKKTLLMTPVQLKRFFYQSPAMQRVRAKQLDIGLK